MKMKTLTVGRVIVFFPIIKLKVISKLCAGKLFYTLIGEYKELGGVLSKLNLLL